MTETATAAPRSASPPGPGCVIGRDARRAAARRQLGFRRSRALGGFASRPCAPTWLSACEPASARSLLLARRRCSLLRLRNLRLLRLALLRHGRLRLPSLRQRPCNCSGTGPPVAQSINSTGCTTGIAVPDAICVMQPMLPAAITSGAVVRDVRDLAVAQPPRRSPAAGYCRCRPSRSTDAPSGISFTTKPQAASRSFGSRWTRWPCCSEQAEWIRDGEAWRRRRRHDAERRPDIREMSRARPETLRRLVAHRPDRCAA